jgi:hypothetical protein
LKPSFNVLKNIRVAIIIIQVVLCIIVVTGRFTKIEIQIYFILFFILAFSQYFLLPLVSYIEQCRNRANRSFLHIIFIVQGVVFLFSIYSFTNVLEVDYKKVGFWIISFFACGFLVILIDIAREIYQTKKYSKSKVNDRLSINAINLLHILLFIIWCFANPTARNLSDMKIPDSVSAAMIQSKHNSSEVFNSFHTIEDTFLISQVIDQISSEKVNNLEYLNNFKYYIDLGITDKYYLYVFHYGAEYYKENLTSGHIDSIVILPNHNVYIEEKRRQNNIFKDPYLRYKVDISSTLVEKLINYAN